MEKSGGPPHNSQPILMPYGPSRVLVLALHFDGQEAIINRDEDDHGAKEAPSNQKFFCFLIFPF